MTLHRQGLSTFLYGTLFLNDSLRISEQESLMQFHDSSLIGIGEATPTHASDGGFHS
jgi:hypothetical protein